MPIDRLLPPLCRRLAGIAITNMTTGRPSSVVHRMGAETRPPPLLSILAIGILLPLVACTAVLPPAEPIPSSVTATATLIACSQMPTPRNRGSILPLFTPAYACELEQAERHVKFCMVHASAELSYPCSQQESVHEHVIGEGGQTQLIQRDYHYSAGCWHGVTSDTRSLRVCDSDSGDSTTLAHDLIGDPIRSPDGAWFAYVAAEPGSGRLKPHIFRVRADGTDLIQLDTQPFPQDQVVGAQIIEWSADGDWLRISLWDGNADGQHQYTLRADGSGLFTR